MRQRRTPPAAFMGERRAAGTCGAGASSGRSAEDLSWARPLPVNTSARIVANRALLGRWQLMIILLGLVKGIPTLLRLSRVRLSRVRLSRVRLSRVRLLQWGLAQELRCITKIRLLKL